MEVFTPTALPLWCTCVSSPGVLLSLTYTPGGLSAASKKGKNSQTNHAILCFVTLQQYDATIKPKYVTKPLACKRRLFSLQLVHIDVSLKKHVFKVIQSQRGWWHRPLHPGMQQPYSEIRFTGVPRSTMVMSRSRMNRRGACYRRCGESGQWKE